MLTGIPPIYQGEKAVFNLDPPAIKNPTIKTVVVPESLYASCRRANFHLMDLLSYDKLKKFASMEDIAVFAYLYNNTKIAGVRLTSIDLYYAMDKQASNEREVDMTLCKMSCMPEIEEIAMNSIRPVDSDQEFLFDMGPKAGQSIPVQSRSEIMTKTAIDKLQFDSPYLLKTSGTTVFVIVGRGFSKYVETTAISAPVGVFVRDFIRSCDELFSSAEVAKHPLFKTFLATL